MSRSNNNEITNPAVRFFEWNGDKGHFKYYDKENKKQIEVALPFTFLVLDCLSTIAGFCESDNSGYWSNEVRDIKKETFTIRTKKGKAFEGNYDAVKAASLTGAKYCQSVYIAFKENKDSPLQIGNVKMVGSSLGSWIEFRKKNKVMEGAITVKSCLEGKKGKTIYQMPVFSKIVTSPETDEKAIALDKELQEYLKAYFLKNSMSKLDEEVLSEAAKEANEIADKEFGSRRSYREDKMHDDGPPADLFMEDENEFDGPTKNVPPSTSVEDDGLPF